MENRSGICKWTDDSIHWRSAEFTYLGLGNSNGRICAWMEAESTFYLRSSKHTLSVLSPKYQSWSASIEEPLWNLHVNGRHLSLEICGPYVPRLKHQQWRTVLEFASERKAAFVSPLWKADTARAKVESRVLPWGVDLMPMGNEGVRRR